MTEAAIALNRFGLGARPDDTVSDDPQRWLTAQLNRFEARPALLASAPTRHQAADYLSQYQQLRRQVREDRAATDPPMAAGARDRAGPRAVMVDDVEPAPIGDAERVAIAARRRGRDAYATSVGLRMNAALVSPAPFVERLVHFWANHFAISADAMRIVGFAGPFEFEAIRPNVLGRFRDLLIAVEQHPAMLLYLDQAQSVGPNSPLGARIAGRAEANGRKVGINENLAREIMELHTLGVRTGYTQGDVTELAKAMTGWTVAGLGRGPAARGTDPRARVGDFVFAGRLHEPGQRSIMGRTYAAGGERQATAILDGLAAHPATARHIATKLVRHFVADDPPPAAVARVEEAFVTSGGDLPSLYRALVSAPEAWAAAPAKFKTPWDWSVSALRGIGLDELGAPQTLGLLQQLGQPTWRPGSPAGWDDIAASWAGPDAVMRRVEAAERFASRAGTHVDALARAAALFPGALTPATVQAIARAESPAQGIALMLVAPEFMRR